MRRQSFVMCIDNRDYPESLERRKVYRAVEDARGSRYGLIRVFDETGEGYLYPRDRFVAISLPASARRAFIAAGRVTPAGGDLLALGEPLGKRPSRRASRALAKLREERL
jgi:hypothetical protein